MTSALSRLIRSRRRELGLSQEALAHTLGVTRQVVAAWEGGCRPVAEHHLLILSQALSVAEQTLQELVVRVPRRGCVVVKNFKTRLEPVKETVQDMLALRGVALRLHDMVARKLGRALHDEVSQCLLRHTCHELLLAYHLLARDGCEPVWLAPLEGECSMLITEDDKRTFIGHYRQMAIRWEGEEERLLFFPQVPILIPKDDVLYCVDFLVGHWRPAAGPCWLAVELDGEPHRYSRVKDEERTGRLQIPVVRFDNHATERSDFVGLLLHRIREVAEYARAVNKEYRTFLTRRRAIRRGH